MVKETLVTAWGEIAAAPFPNCSSWAIWQAVRGAGRQSPGPSGVHQAEPGQREAMSEQPHTWLANAGRSDGVPASQAAPWAICCPKGAMFFH